MRLLLNFLAVLGGLFSGLLVLAGCMVCVRGFGLFFADDARWQGVSPTGRLLIVAMGIGFGIMGGVFVRRTYRHFRRPDRNTAYQVVGMITLLGALQVMNLLWQKKLVAPSEPLLQLAVFAAVVVRAYLFHRLALKPLATRAYPPEAVITTN